MRIFVIAKLPRQVFSPFGKVTMGDCVISLLWILVPVASFPDGFFDMFAKKLTCDF